MRIIGYYLRHVFYCGSIIACILQQHRAVKKREQIVGFKTQHEVEIFYSLIVLTYARTQKSAVVMPKKVGRIYLKRAVIVIHRPAQVSLLIAHKCAVDIIVGNVV